LENALINGYNEGEEYHCSCFIIGINVFECFNRNYNYGYDSLLEFTEKKLLKFQEPMQEYEENSYFDVFRQKNKEVMVNKYTF
jgi:hypothetical protein